MARNLCRITTSSRSRRALPGSFIASAGGMIHIAHADRCVCGLGFYDHAFRSNAEACQKAVTLVSCALEQVRILSSTNRRRKIKHGHTVTRCGECGGAEKAVHMVHSAYSWLRVNSNTCCMKTAFTFSLWHDAASATLSLCTPQTMGYVFQGQGQLLVDPSLPVMVPARDSQIAVLILARDLGVYSEDGRCQTSQC